MQAKGGGRKAGRKEGRADGLERGSRARRLMNRGVSWFISRRDQQLRRPARTETALLSGRGGGGNQDTDTQARVNHPGRTRGNMIDSNGIWG